MRKVSTKWVISPLAIMMVFALAIFVLTPDYTLAANEQSSWTKAGIVKGSDITKSSIYSDMDNIIYFIMAVGGFWVIGCLLFAGMKLSAAQGNPQARTQGFIGLAMSALGMFVIVKAYDIAGWVAGFGG